MIIAPTHSTSWLNEARFCHAWMSEAYLRPTPGIFITVE